MSGSPSFLLGIGKVEYREMRGGDVKMILGFYVYVNVHVNVLKIRMQGPFVNCWHF